MSNELDEIVVEKKKVRTDSYFDGKFLEYIGYKLLAFIITIITFTIAKPWADKLILDYKINHTLYNGKRLKFEGKGSSLFVQRFKWFLLTIITLGIYSFWIPIKMEQWIISNIHFEDEDLVEGESFFDGKLLGLIGVNIFTYLVTLVSLGLLFPFAICYKQKWIVKHMVINRKKFVFDGKALSVIVHYLLWYLLSIITVGIYGLWVPMKMYDWEVKHTHLKLKDEKEEKGSILPIIICIMLLIAIIIGLVNVIPKINIPAYFSGDKNIKDIFVGNTNERVKDTQRGYLKEDYNTGGEASIRNDYTDKTTTKTSNKDVIKNESVKTTTVNVERCDSGYVYYEGMCYNPNDYKEPIYTCSSDMVHANGSCYPKMSDSLCEENSELYTYIQGQCVDESMASQEGFECLDGYDITVPHEAYGFESMMCYRYKNPNY